MLKSSSRILKSDIKTLHKRKQLAVSRRTLSAHLYAFSTISRVYPLPQPRVHVSVTLAEPQGREVFVRVAVVDV